MKKRTLALTALGTCMLISSCTYDKDPFLDFKNEAKAKYIEYYENNPGVEKAPLFYFDITTLRSALVRNENEVSFLGQMKLTDFTFSESKNYFADVGNLPISVTDSNSDGMPDQFKVGDFVSTDADGNTNFDVKTFVNNLPLVLHEVKADKTIATYSMLSSDGRILDSSNAKAYDPDFFYISDLKLQIQGLEGFADELLDFTGKDVCILRKDLYQVLGDLTATAIPEQIENFFSVSELFNGLYRKAKGLSSNDEMPQAISIKGKHQTSFDEKSAREVVVGPFSLINELLNKFVPSETTAEAKPSLIHEIPTIYIEEGVDTVSLFAFNGTRENGDSTSKIKKIYLPSTLQNVQFNAFSNLDLDSLYIDKTYQKTEDGNLVEEPFDFVDFGDVQISMGEGESELQLDVTGSFSHSKIENLYFEGYDNQNIEWFPFSSTINLATDEGINKALKIYSKDDGTINAEKVTNLSEAFERYHTVNPFYQISLAPNEDKKYTLTSGLSAIGSGKTLYLPSDIYSLFADDSRVIYLGENSREGRPEESLLTLKLDQDLTIKKGGQLIIGSYIGSTGSQSGVSTGGFSSLDLNGHKLIVEEGGTVISDGFIFDSSASKAGKVELKKGSKLTTNVTINNYKNLNDVMERIDNGVAPIDSYSLNSLQTNVEVEQGATVLGNLDYIDNGFYNENVINLISSSNQALFQLTSGKLVVNQSKISSLSGSNVTINHVDLIKIKDNTSSETTDEVYGSKDFPFAIANDTFKVELDNVTNLTNLYVDETSNLKVNNLTLGDNSSLIGVPNNKLEIANSITLDSKATKVTLAGEFKLNNNTYSSMKNIFQEYDGSLISKFDLVKEVTTNDDVSFKKTSYNLTGFVGESSSSFTQKLFKNTRGYYYAYSNNGSSGKLINSFGNELATYTDTQSTWFNGSVNTNVSKDSLISSYKGIDELHILEEVDNKVVWVDKKINPLPNGTYDVDGKPFIKPFKSDEFVEGKFIENTPIGETIFETKLDGKKYVYTPVSLSDSSQKSWVEIEAYDNYATLQIVDKNIQLDLKYIALINNKYELGFDYNSTQHIATKTSGSTTKKYAYTNEKRYEEFNPNALKWEDKQIKDNDDKLIYLTENQSWARVDELHKGLCKFLMPNGSFYYYFLINNKWYQSVEGEVAKTYNKLADMSFGVIQDKITYNGSKYKFVMRNGDSDDTPFELFLPQELIKVTKQDFPDLWPEDAATDHLYAYRHIVKNDGSSWLFFKDEETNKVSLKKFKFAPGFTPTQPDGSNTNVLTKFNFVIYKVIFEGETTPRTLYVLTDSSDKNNAIYAGNTNLSESGELTDEYLAIAIFTTTNPIDDLVNGNLPIPQ